MVVFNNISNNEKSNGESTPPPNLLILEKLKQARMQRALLKECEKKEVVKKVPIEHLHKKFVGAADITSSSSSLSINKDQLIRRTTVQEKLFSMQCQNFNENKHGNGPCLKSNSSDSSSSTKRYRRHSIQEDDDLECPTATAGVLHFKQPLVNRHNESIYYESRGRMEPVDWSALGNKKSNSFDILNYVKESNRNAELPDKIKNLQENKPEPSPEFSNFVSNSSTSDTVYEGRNNLEQIRNTIDSPLLKIQRIITNSAKDVLLMNQEIKQAFEPSQPEPYIINTIDSPTKNSISIQNGKSESCATLEDIEGQSKNLAQKQPLNSIMKLIPNICEFDSKDVSFAIMNKKVSDSNNKKKSVDEYSDDMFNFVNVRSKTNSNSTMNSGNSSINNGLSTPLSNESSQSMNCKSNSRYNKLKQYLLNHKLNSSLDSDDLSLPKTTKEITSEQEPILSKVETPRKESRNASTQCSTQPIKNFNDSFSTSDDSEEAVSENNEVLLKTYSTRYFKKPNANTVSHVKEMETKTALDQEPLLREVSTRYFAKSSNVENKIMNVDKKMYIPNKTRNPSDIKDVDSLNIYQRCFKESKFTPVNEISSENEIDRNQDLDSSLKSNDSINETVSRKIFIKKCITDLNEREISNNLNVEDSVSTDNDYCTTIFHEHKSIKKNSIEIEEVDINTENSKKSRCLAKTNVNNELSSDSIQQNNLAVDDDIKSDDEFDIVNIEQFTPFAMLVDKLQKFKVAQKEIATGIMNSDDSTLLDGEENNKHNCSSSSISKSTEDSSEASENNYSGAVASVSSNIDTDNDISLNSSSSFNILHAKKILKNVKIDEIKLNDTNVNSSKSEFKTINELEPDSKTEISSRRNKMKNALISFQKKHESKDSKEGGDQVQKLDDLEQNKETKETLTKRHQILQKIKRRNNI